MKLSLLIPVFNEARSLPLILDKLARLNIDGVDLEMVFVDDASSDDSFRMIQDFAAGRPNARVARHDQNRGKGAAVRNALGLATGDIAVIQDADLEYDPEDFHALVKPILAGRADVVFGSRNLMPNPRYSRIYYWGNLLLNACVFLLYGRYVSDMETCYKMMRRPVFLDLDIRSNRFDIEPEITAKLLRRGHAIAEVPIRYVPRTRAEGKKITWKDGAHALWTLLYWRFARLAGTS
ncbi:glycosyltransferase family 2 protein [bacterium]|nr:glycosyltransferase family 2 protein [bacterium]